MSASKAEEQAAREDVHTYAEAIAHFETNDIGDELETMLEVDFDVHLPPRRPLYPLDTDLATKLQVIASRRGVSAQTLLNLWVQEKVAQASPASSEKAAEILTVSSVE